MESLEQFFNDNDRGYPRDPRRMAYAKLKKNIQGMDREQLEAFIKANLFIPHSQYKMALGNLIQFLNKQDKMNRLNEVKQFQKIAGLLKEGRDVVDGIENIFLTQDYIQELQEVIDSPKDSEIQDALLVYVAALEDAWRSFDDDVDSRNPDFENIWHNLDYGKAISNGQVVGYTDAEKKLKSLDPDLQEEIWDLFLDGKQEYYS